MGNRKGDARERELRDVLDARGFVVIRAAGSGSAPGFDLPDLLVGDGVHMWAVEVKAWNPSKKNTRYLDSEEADALRRMSDEFFPDCEARVGVRLDRNTTWFLPRLSDLSRTDSGNVPLNADAVDEFPTLDDLLPDDD